MKAVKLPASWPQSNLMAGLRDGVASSRKTADEIDRDTDSRFGGRSALAVLLDLQNQIRALRGEPPLTLDEFRAELVARF